MLDPELPVAMGYGGGGPTFRGLSLTASVLRGNGKGWGWGWPPMMWFPKGFGKGKGWGRRRGPRIEPEMKIWIGGLPEDCTWKDLQTLGNSVASTRWVEVFRGKGGLRSRALLGRR